MTMESRGSNLPQNKSEVIRQLREEEEALERDRKKNQKAILDNNKLIILPTAGQLKEREEKNTILFNEKAEIAQKIQEIRDKIQDLEAEIPVTISPEASAATPAKKEKKLRKSKKGRVAVTEKSYRATPDLAPDRGDHIYGEPYPNSKLLESDPKLKPMLDKFEQAAEKTMKEALENAKLPKIKPPKVELPPKILEIIAQELSKTRQNVENLRRAHVMPALIKLVETDIVKLESDPESYFKQKRDTANKEATRLGKKQNPKDKERARSWEKQAEEAEIILKQLAALKKVEVKKTEPAIPAVQKTAPKPEKTEVKKSGYHTETIAGEKVDVLYVDGKRTQINYQNGIKDYLNKEGRVVKRRYPSYDPGEIDLIEYYDHLDDGTTIVRNHKNEILKAIDRKGKEIKTLKEKTVITREQRIAQLREIIAKNEKILENTLRELKEIEERIKNKEKAARLK